MALLFRELRRAESSLTRSVKLNPERSHEGRCLARKASVDTRQKSGSRKLNRRAVDAWARGRTRPQEGQRTGGTEARTAIARDCLGCGRTTRYSVTIC